MTQSYWTNQQERKKINKSFSGKAKAALLRICKSHRTFRMPSRARFSHIIDFRHRRRVVVTVATYDAAVEARRKTTSRETAPVREEAGKEKNCAHGERRSSWCIRPTT